MLFVYVPFTIKIKGWVFHSILMDLSRLDVDILIDVSY